MLHLVAVEPNRRRQGLGRQLVERFVAQMTSAGVETISAIAWPGEPPAIAFFEAVGFVAQGGPGSQRIHGTTAFPDYDGDGADRVVFVRNA